VASTALLLLAQSLLISLKLLNCSLSCAGIVSLLNGYGIGVGALVPLTTYISSDELALHALASNSSSVISK
jgi:hypothetical protein